MTTTTTTTEQFRDCFVSEKGYDALKKLMRHGNDVCAEISKCWQERHELEIAYTKGLRKNSDTLKKIAGRSKGSLVNAFGTIAEQTSAESSAHQLMADTLLDKISVPMKNLAETQSKARKPIEDVLNAKFKAWKDQKEVDTKYRQRQFEKCKEIEGLYLRMDEIPKTTKNSVKESGKDMPLMTTCVFPGGRYVSGSEKIISTWNIESALQKLEQELDKTEKKYHDATKEVEVTRQFCDVEMCRACDQMQTMELDRIIETDKFIQTYAGAMKTLNETLSQITGHLTSIHITPHDDVTLEAKQSLQTTETEILLYDIYAENENHTMSHERRILSLMHWMQMLKQDIEIQRRSKDGIENLQGFCKQNQKFSGKVDSNEIFVNRQSVRLLKCLYEGSLYKMEKVYNHLKSFPEPNYEYSQRYAKSYTDKGVPTTFLRIPFQAPAQASEIAPSPMVSVARATPMAPPPPPSYSVHAQAPIGWAIPDLPHEHSAAGFYPPYGHSMASTPPYPVLPSSSSSSSSPVMMRSTDSHRHQPAPSAMNRVQVLHAYDALHDDELSIRPGEIITLLERRSDQWCKGSLRGNVGLFPGNFVQDI